MRSAGCEGTWVGARSPRNMQGMSSSWGGGSSTRWAVARAIGRLERNSRPSWLGLACCWATWISGRGGSHLPGRSTPRTGPFLRRRRQDRQDEYGPGLARGLHGRPQSGTHAAQESGSVQEPGWPEHHTPCSPHEGQPLPGVPGPRPDHRPEGPKNESSGDVAWNDHVEVFIDGDGVANDFFTVAGNREGFRSLPTLVVPSTPMRWTS